MKNYDLIILVIASYNDYYKGFINNYWLPLINYINKNNDKYNIKIFLIFGEKISELNIPEDNLIISNEPETYIPGILRKTIFAFDYVNKNFIYKHVLRTNLSSFFILDELIKINQQLPFENVYAGVCTNTFVSGAAFWLSIDVLKFILQNKNKLNYNIIDDVSIGKLCKNINKTSLPRYTISHKKYQQNN